MRRDELRPGRQRLHELERLAGSALGNVGFAAPLRDGRGLA